MIGAIITTFEKESVSEVSARLNEIHGDKYEFPYIESEFNDFKSIITLVCPIHGEVKVSIGSLLYSKCWCSKCKGFRIRLSIKYGREIANRELIKLYKYIGENRDKFDIHDMKQFDTDLIQTMYDNFRKTNAESSLLVEQDREITALTDPSVILQRIKDIHGDVFSFPRIGFELESIVSPLTAVCPVHGEFSTSIKSIIHNEVGCPKCGSMRQTLSRRYGSDKALMLMKVYYEDFIKNHRKEGDMTAITKVMINEILSTIKDKTMFGKYYHYPKLRNEYKSDSSMITAICPIHGTFSTSVLRLRENSGCVECSHLRRNLTKLYGNNKDFVLKELQYFYDFVLRSNIRKSDIKAKSTSERTTTMYKMYIDSPDYEIDHKDVKDLMKPVILDGRLRLSTRVQLNSPSVNDEEESKLNTTEESLSSTDEKSEVDEQSAYTLDSEQHSDDEIPLVESIQTIDEDRDMKCDKHETNIDELSVNILVINKIIKRLQMIRDEDIASLEIKLEAFENISIRLTSGETFKIFSSGVVNKKDSICDIIRKYAIDHIDDLFKRNIISGYARAPIVTAVEKMINPMVTELQAMSLSKEMTPEMIREEVVNAVNKIVNCNSSAFGISPFGNNFNQMAFSHTPFLNSSDVVDAKNVMDVIISEFSVAVNNTIDSIKDKTRPIVTKYFNNNFKDHVECLERQLTTEQKQSRSEIRYRIGIYISTIMQELYRDTNAKVGGK